MSDESLPPGWARAKFEDILIDPKSDLVDGPFGSNLKSSEYVESGVPVLKIQNIKADRFVRKHFSYVTKEKAIELSRHSFIPGDLMITKLGDPLGLCCEVPDDFPAGVFVADLMRLRLRMNRVSKRFLLLAINSQVVQSQFKDITKGTTRPRVNLTIVRSIEIPLPPLAEQKRIVAKIEELFSELEAGEESLRVARRQLGVYRQSLLKQAFEGKLTEKWRTQNPDKLESPAALTDVILARSRSAKFKANQDHEIPSWSNRTLDELTESVTSGSRGWADYYADSGSIFIRAQNLNQDFLNLADIAYVRLPESAEGKRTRVKYGDLLITITGANTTKAGWVFTQLDEAYVSQHVALCRPVSDTLSPFLYHYIIADAGGRKKLTADAYGAGKPGLNLDNVRSLAVPLPSLPEQQEIVRLLDAQFEVIERNEREIDAALRRSEALRQAILKKAFTGRLVPQDPSDEPASVLLARLRAKRTSASAVRRTPKSAAV